MRKLLSKNAIASVDHSFTPLENEVMFLFPQENLEEYTHAARIKRSYQKAIKQYPPASLVWK